jgi:23S rRNA (adenine2503-C2)-methyltransferase
MTHPLGLTFDEWRRRGGHPVASAQTRAEFRRLFAADPPGDPAAEPLPVFLSRRDGELVKFIQRRPDGLEIESVLIPMRRGGSRWTSLCVSSQVGCGRGCTFCETAQLGLLRQLPAWQIVGQLVAARRHFGADVRNVVFMGMGEPFDNFEEVVAAVRVVTDPVGLSLGMSRITISTVGRIDGIRRLSALGWRRINLAVSLNAPNDEIRSRIMPINRTEPMAELRAALLEYPLRSCQFFMIEYVLIAGVNDEPEHARELADYLRPLKCCVNVIPYNPRLDSPFRTPDESAVARFLTALREAGQFCKRRVTQGRDFMAACGQLGNRTLTRIAVQA